MDRIVTLDSRQEAHLNRLRPTGSLPSTRAT